MHRWHELLTNDEHLDEIPGYLWDEKGLQRQKGIGLIVGIQERRALLAPVINRR